MANILDLLSRMEITRDYWAIIHDNRGILHDNRVFRRDYRLLFPIFVSQREISYEFNLLIGCWPDRNCVLTTKSRLTVTFNDFCDLVFFFTIIVLNRVRIAFDTTY